MNAFQPRTPTQQPVETHRMARRTQRRQRRHSYQAVVGETTARLAVNLVLCTAAIAGLVKLLPYHAYQQARLREVRTDVQGAEGRVKSLRADFTRTFDSRQSKSVMQEQSYRVDENQRPVVLKDSTPNEDNY